MKASLVSTRSNSGRQPARPADGPVSAISPPSSACSSSLLSRSWSFDSSLLGAARGRGGRVKIERAGPVGPARFRLIVALVDVDVLGVDHVLAGTALRSARRAAGARAGARFRARPGRLAIHRLRQLVRGLLELLAGTLHRRRVLALERLPGVGDRRLQRRAMLGLELVLVLLERLVGGIDEPVELVARLHLLAPLLVLLAVQVGVLDHLVDVGLRQARRGGDGDLLLLAGAH